MGRCLDKRLIKGRLIMTEPDLSVALAPIGGVTATIALLTCLPAAKADELADLRLRANYEMRNSLI